MSPFMRLYFWTHRAAWRAGVLVKLLVRLALLAVAVFVAIEVGQILVTFVVAVAALVVLFFILGSFTAGWRTAGVRVGQRYRRLTRRGRVSGKDSHR